MKAGGVSDDVAKAIVIAHGAVYVTGTFSSTA